MNNEVVNSGVTLYPFYDFSLTTITELPILFTSHLSEAVPIIPSKSAHAIHLLRLSP